MELEMTSEKELARANSNVKFLGWLRFLLLTRLERYFGGAYVGF